MEIGLLVHKLFQVGVLKKPLIQPTGKRVIPKGHVKGIHVREYYPNVQYEDQLVKLKSEQIIEKQYT